MQTQWPGLGPNFDLSSLDAAGGEGRPLWPNAGVFGSPPPQPGDGVGRSWWSCGTANANAGNPLAGLFYGNSAAGSTGTLAGLLSGLIATLQQLVGSLLSQGAPQGKGAWNGPLPDGPQQRFTNLDVSSTGDPHIVETGTRSGPGAQSVDDRWDSMTSHDDLVHSNQIEGGYRVSTAVTSPDANGVTSNQSATVHANFDQDSISMNRDGSFAIYDNGERVELGKGESADLSGGETVTVNQDGSLNVNASARNGGTISTSLHGTGVGVDVTTHAQNLAVGGDAVNHDAAAGAGTRKAHGGHHHRHAAAAVVTAP